MTLLAIVPQLYLIYGTFIAFPAGGVITAAVLIGTGFPMYYFFRMNLEKSKR